MLSNLSENQTGDTEKPGTAYRLVVGLDPGSTAVKAHDGTKTVLIDSVVALASKEVVDLDSIRVDDTRQTQMESPSFLVRSQAGAAAYWVGQRASRCHRPRFLSDQSKDSPDVALLLDCALVALAGEDARVIEADVVTNIPIEEYLEGSLAPRLKHCLEGTRRRIINGHSLTFRVQVLDVLPEGVPVMYFLSARRQLASRSRAFKVLDFGGRTLDLAYLLAEGKVVRDLSKHFEEGHDTFLVRYIEDWLKREHHVPNVARAQIRNNIHDASFEYVAENQTVYSFAALIGEAEQEYATSCLGRISELWRGVPADQVIVLGGGATPAVITAVLQRFPAAQILPEAFARIAGAIGLYHRATKLIQATGNP
jgi:hypothetical protein